MTVTIRRAVADDVPEIVALLADDSLGAKRESPDDLTPYQVAFKAVDADPNQLLVVVEHEGAVVGTAQLSYIPGLSRRGALRAQIEGVRVRSDQRGTGLGERMMRWLIDTARERGADVVQLTSDVTREGAHRFYQRLGFQPTHVGFKMAL
ncbi:MAG: GNAT family N-acetyltransferase [Thermocrispum agreste]|uniref:GNAT family N-acetyltransferase n=1 Tax=Thermocrispum agreste TaxID=37925 RepID=A0A2W4L8M0_9PSEU|nr:MAG: GNAT family N-acetyltransferase [Thermocrispum agreste]